MTSKQFNERFGTEWEAPASAASDEQVGQQMGTHANGSPGPAQDGTFDGRQQSSLMQLAEQTVIEAHKLAERIKEQGVKDGEAEAERIASIAGEKAKRQAATLLEAAQEEAAANANAVAAQAEQDA